MLFNKVFSIFLSTVFLKRVQDRSNSRVMQKTQNLHTRIFHSLGDQLAVIDQTGCILEVNLAWETFGVENGLPPDFEFIGHNYLATLSASAAVGDSLAIEARKGIMAVLQGSDADFYFEYPCHSPDELRWFTMRCAPLHGDDSKSLFLISHHNVTKRKLAEEQVKKLAMQDPLTGIANRRHFQLFLDREMRSNVRNKTPISLVLIDVDYFKRYNDEFGHAAGDQCLQSVSQILLAHARRPGDLAARIGGDEFALILGNTSLPKAIMIAESVLAAINALQMTFNDSTKVTASLGLASVVSQDQHYGDALFQEADRALYHAKDAGRNQVMHLQKNNAP